MKNSLIIRYIIFKDGEKSIKYLFSLVSSSQDTLVARIKELEDQLKEANFLCNCKDDAIRKGEQARIRLREAYEQLASSSLLSGVLLCLIYEGFISMIMTFLLGLTRRGSS